MRNYDIPILDNMMTSSLPDMKVRVIEGHQRTYSFWGQSDLSSHLEMLTGEFAGRPEIEFYHAALTVLIRRNILLKDNVERIRILWEQECDYLCRNLDSRWLVSACDTIADHWPDRSERALGLAGSLLTNTIKLYETERWATNQYASVAHYRPIDTRVPLHDGLSAFLIGRGNMVRNLCQRAAVSFGTESTAARILGELLRRASIYDTVYKRFRDVHVNESTLWPVDDSSDRSTN